MVEKGHNYQVLTQSIKKNENKETIGLFSGCHVSSHSCGFINLNNVKLIFQTLDMTPKLLP